MICRPSVTAVLCCVYSTFLALQIDSSIYSSETKWTRFLFPLQLPFTPQNPCAWRCSFYPASLCISRSTVVFLCHVKVNCLKAKLQSSSPSPCMTYLSIRLILLIALQQIHFHPQSACCVQYALTLPLRHDWRSSLNYMSLWVSFCPLVLLHYNSLDKVWPHLLSCHVTSSLPCLLWCCEKKRNTSTPAVKLFNSHSCTHTLCAHGSYTEP